MNASVHDFPQPPQEPPKPAVVKKRVITLTNRAPIVIVEDEWPVAAENGWGTEMDGPPWGWSISMKVRHRKDDKRNYGPYTIIHATYRTFDEDDEENFDRNQVVRVGRLLTINQTMSDLWKHILEVGEELRQRMLEERRKKYVTLVVDGVLANLSPHKE